MDREEGMFDFDYEPSEKSHTTAPAPRAPKRDNGYEEEAEKISLNKSLESDASIKWQKEIDLHRVIDTAIIIEGNVNDQQIYSKGENVEIMSIENYLYDYLHSIGYETVIFFNHIEGFYNKDKSEYKRFMKIADRAEVRDEGVSDEGVNDDRLSDADMSLFGEALKKIRAAMNNKDEPVAIVMCDVSRYIASPSTIDENNQFFYSKLSLATKTKRPFKKSGLHNIMFLVAEKANDIPAWFYLNNPRVKTVTIPVPDMNIRKLYIDGYYDNFSHNRANESEEEIAKNKELFVNYTEGFKL